MVGKPNLPSDAETRHGLMGSSISKHGTPLDQERAASMADEGGVSGARMDTREQHSPVDDELLSQRFWTWVVWGAVAAGCAALAATLIVRQRARA